MQQTRTNGDSIGASHRIIGLLATYTVAILIAYASATQVDASEPGPRVRGNLHLTSPRMPHPPRPPKTDHRKAKRTQESIAKRVKDAFPDWRGQKELQKVLREVEKRGMGRGNKFLKEGIVAHEGGNHKGHTIGSHVGVSAKDLRARIEFEKNRIAESKKEKGDKDAKKDHRSWKEPVSSFKDIRAADRFIDKTLTDKQNFSRLSNWAKKNNNKGELILTLRDAGAATGLAVHPKTKQLVEARGVRVVLRRDGSRRGWSIVTAYPIVAR